MLQIEKGDCVKMEMLFMRFASYDLWFYGGLLLMGLAAVFFVVQAVFYFVKKAGIRKKLDEEYGQPQKYHVRERG